MSCDRTSDYYYKTMRPIEALLVERHNEQARNREAADPAPKRQQGERERLRRLKRLEAQQ